jgi:ubiquinone/menaquinone biosynthesis C-methylase UbiE
MIWKASTTYTLAVVVVVALVLGTIAWRFVFFFAPFAWTGEPTRLAQVLGLRPGMKVADIGAGSGALAMEMAPVVSSTGQVFATELDPKRRGAIERRISGDSVPNVRTVAASETETGLPDSCCDAIYMRAVFHHVADGPTFAASIVRALRPVGRVAVIDFPPGSLWFHGAEHGVQPASIVTAFQTAGLKVREQVDDWGGGMYLIVFEAGAGQ